MLKEIIKKIDNAKETLDKLVLRYGLADNKVMKQSKKLDELISEYYNVRKLKIEWCKINKKSLKNIFKSYFLSFFVIYMLLIKSS